MTSWAFSRKIANRYLWTKRTEAFVSIITIVSIIGVALGVMVLNIVMAIMTGFEVELREKIVGTEAHIVIEKAGGQIDGWNEVSEKVRSVEGITSISPYTSHQVLARSNARSVGLLVRGISQDSPLGRQVADSLEKGPDSLSVLFNPPRSNVLRPSGEEAEAILPGIVLGRELTRHLYTAPGQAISILSSQLGNSPLGILPKFEQFVVTGRYASSRRELEDRIGYITLATAQRFFGMGNAVTGLEVRVKDIDAAPQIALRVLDVLGGEASGFSANDWTGNNKPLRDAMRLQKRVYFVVLLLITIMASFSIVTTLVMIVIEKQKDISILKTLGATTRSIARVFRIQGAVIGGLGTSLGLLLGYLSCFGLRWYGFPLDERSFGMSKLPVRIEFVNFSTIGAAAFAICLIATIYPARRAALLNPSEGLRRD